MLKKIICIVVLFVSQNVFANNNADPMCDKVVALMSQSDKVLVYVQAKATKANNATTFKDYEFVYSLIPKAKKKTKLLGGIFDEAHFGKQFVDKDRNIVIPLEGVTSQNQISYSANSYNSDDEKTAYRVLTAINDIQNATITLEEPARAGTDSTGVYIPAKKGKYKTFAWGISKMCLDKNGCDAVQLDDFDNEKADSDEEPETVKKHFNRGDWYFILIDELDKTPIKDKEVWGFVYPSTEQLPSISKCLPTA